MQEALVALLCAPCLRVFGFLMGFWCNVSGFFARARVFFPALRLMQKDSRRYELLVLAVEAGMHFLLTGSGILALPRTMGQVCYLILIWTVSFLVAGLAGA